MVSTTTVQAIEKIDYDFSSITKNMSEITRLAWIARSLLSLPASDGFIERDIKKNVLNISPLSIK